MPRRRQEPRDLPPPKGGNHSSAGAAEEYLRQLLLDGGLDPGDPVPVDEIAANLGTSRQPVLQAVRKLAAEGFLDVRPQAGSWVQMPSPLAVGDFYGLFAVCESYIAKLAAERRDEMQVELVQFEADAIEARAVKLGAPDLADPAYRSLNRAFHELIHQLACSPEVTAIAQTHWDRSDFYIRAAFGSLHFDRSTTAAHRDVINAIVAGDSQRASAAMANHLQHVGARVVARLTKGS